MATIAKPAVTKVEKLVISRYWDNPQISYMVNADGINITIALDQYLYALAEEIGNPAILMTKAQLLKALYMSSSVVCEKVKQATAQG